MDPVASTSTAPPPAIPGKLADASTSATAAPPPLPSTVSAAAATLLASTSTTAPPPTAGDSAATQTTTKKSWQPKVPKPLLPRTIVREGDNVLLRLPSKTIKPVKVTPNGTINLGKYGSFKGKELLGLPYGDTYEIKEGTLHAVQTTLNEIEETAANNENISSTGAQKLTFEDILALKKDGMSGREIIQKQVEEHAAFELKTEYSKEKYMKRKEAKFLHMFTLVEPTVHEICWYNFEKQASSIRDLRPDTLSQMMSLANVRPGGKVLIVEDLHGIVVAAAVERTGGDGRILVINDYDSPPDLHLCDSFNFGVKEMDPIMSINWAATEEDYEPPALPMDVVEDPEKRTNSREISKLRKRKATFEKAVEAREEFFAGEFDGVIVACEYEPYSILERLLPSIGGSAPIVVFSQYLNVLQDCHSRLRANPEFLAPTIVEPWLRKYQVLPGRAHPEMNGLNHGGFLLTVTRVYDDPDSQSVMAGRGKRRKTKREADVTKDEVETSASTE